MKVRWFSILVIILSLWTSSLTAVSAEPAPLPPLQNIQAVAGGSSHACALTTAGGVKCWGQNWTGQLGDGAATQRSLPADVAGLTSGVAGVAAGQYHTCAVMVDGGVKCWGNNGFGQLGDGTTTQRATPVDVTGLASGVAAVTAGNNHTCAMTAGGGLKCWGDNRNGQLGDGTVTRRNTPTDVAGLPGGLLVADAGSNHTCAVTAGGGVKCWGLNMYGQLGDSTVTLRQSPVDVTGLASGSTTISAGQYHTCAVTAGAVKCWGWDSYGQLGQGTITYRTTPVDVVTWIKIYLQQLEKGA